MINSLIDWLEKWSKNNPTRFRIALGLLMVFVMPYYWVIRALIDRWEWVKEDYVLAWKALKKGNDAT